jgi:hypothetical protein
MVSVFKNGGKKKWKSQLYFPVMSATKHNPTKILEELVEIIDWITYSYLTTHLIPGPP